MSSVFSRYKHAFDHWSTPKWIMVPEGDYNYFYIDSKYAPSLDTKASSNVKLSYKPSKFRKGQLFVSLKGLKRGPSRIKAVQKGSRKVVEKLDLNVLPRQTITVALGLVSDVKGHGTKLTSSQARKEVEQASNLLLRETNTRLKIVASENVKVYRDLGESVDMKLNEHRKVTDAAAPAWWEKLMMMTPRFKNKFPEYMANVTVLFTHEIAEYCSLGCKGFGPAGIYVGGTKYVLIEDQHRGVIDEVIAHEIGHFVGCSHAKQKDNLMYWGAQIKTVGKNQQTVTNTNLGRPEILQFHRRQMWGTQTKFD